VLFSNPEVGLGQPEGRVTMRPRGSLLAVIAAATCLTLPATATAAGPASTSAQPPAAALDDAGRLTVNFTVDRFIARDGSLKARGTAVARLSGAGQSTKTVRQRVTAPVRIAQAGRRRCPLITLELATLRLDLLGLRVETSEINLRISGIRRGAGSGVLGRLLCSLNSSTVRIGRASEAHAAARALNSAVPRKGLRGFTATAELQPQAAASQAPTSCPVLDLQLGPLELNVLGLLVELFGPSRTAPVRITITAFRGGGLLGDLFCGLAGTAPPVVPESRDGGRRRHAGALRPAAGSFV
jgi:hypothetical protein